MSHPYLHPMVRELASHGITEYSVEQRSKSMALVFTWNGQKMVKFFPITPSDKNGFMAAVKDIRHMLGVERVIVKNTERRANPRRKAARQSAQIDPPSLTVIPDPFARLAVLADPLAAMLDRLERRIQLAEYRLSFFRGSFGKWERSR